MSENPRPLVSVGIPTFNGANRIEKALSSLLAQDYPNLEIIISDNASIDGTRELCESYARTDHRINYHRQARNLGLMPNFEYLLHVANGKYFIFLSDDDAMAENILTDYVDFLESNPDHAMVCGKVNYYLDDKLYECEEGVSLQDNNPMIRSLKLYQSAKMAGLIHGMFRRDWGNKLRLKSILGNDWHFIAALAFKGKIHQIDKVGYHKGMDGTSSNFHKYVRTMGENFIWGYMPFGKISLDAFREIFYKEKVYRSVSLPLRLLSAIYASLSILINYFLIIKPKVRLIPPNFPA
ncbi:MAG: glycosyltransferase [Bacteroidota bacterium]